MRATRNVPNDVCTIAIPPTAASTDAASIVTDTVRPATAAVADGSCVAVEGDVELPPLLVMRQVVLSDRAFSELGGVLLAFGAVIAAFVRPWIRRTCHTLAARTPCACKTS